MSNRNRSAPVDHDRATEQVKAEISAALTPLVKQARARIVARATELGSTPENWWHSGPYDTLEDKHPLQGLAFSLQSPETLGWLDDDKLELWVRDVIQNNIKDVSRFVIPIGLHDPLASRRRRWSWHQLAFLPALRIRGRFDYTWYESAPR